jgi:diaminohydroxyphosphoribosylaminopyrimidine deaminase/5-amino-6-(5-phosphoribosylamino)uracil reductase
MAFTKLDYQYMQQAISLAKQGHFTTSPNPRVGCILVNNGYVIGEGYHQKAGEGHAEVNALKEANKHNKAKIKGAIAYVTLEPCSHFGRTPPCAQGLIDAGISHVVIAMVDPNPQVSGRGVAMLEAAGITTSVGLLEEEAKSLNIGFIHLMTTGLPYVRCKLAASLDGKTAMASGESKWITGAQAREDVQRLRAASCAIISGADSIITDNAKMTVRWSELGSLKNRYPQSILRQPVRVIIDSKNRLTPDLALFQQQTPIILMRTAIEKQHNWPHFVEQVVCLPDGEQAKIERAEQVDLAFLLRNLAARGFNDILIESGARLTGAFIEQNLVNELILYQAPKLMGAESKSLISLPQIKTLDKAKQLTIADVRMVGDDIKIIAKFHTGK